MSKITVTAFRWVPPFAQGLVRDLRVRWALEEAGLAYEERLIGPDDQNTPAHRQRQPFGQVPVLEQDGLTLFESGAIVLHIAEQSPVLLPSAVDARLRVRTWMFAALSTVEPPILALNSLGMKTPTNDGVVPTREQVAGRVDQRLDSLAGFLEGKQYLEGDFSAADLLMTTVLRVLRDTDRVASRPVLRDYQERCESRPAFRRALAAQMSAFERHAPANA
ncbi:MAG TPA: glutathione S-transferase family protein [Ramlibacter sp.]|nr:glutathione S-transferase family protein [Ramlibacter sp.]